jgi:hypothetical protein
MLIDEEIKQLQEIYKKRFGREISREKAYEDGVTLIQLMRLIYKSMTPQEYQDLQRRRKETE